MFEQEAARRVESALDRLAGLDTVEDAPTLDVFRRTFELELAAARDHVGRLGEGLLVGSVGFALGVDLERVFVCGLAEGVFPAPPRDDPLLADAERSVLNGELPLRAERVDDDHRALLAALASTAGERVLCFPRGDLRRSTERVPSRFLIDTVEVLTGTRPSAEELARVEGDWCRSVASFVHGVVARRVSGHRAGAQPAVAARSHRGARDRRRRAPVVRTGAVVGAWCRARAGAPQ